jgi:thioredoxin 1
MSNILDNTVNQHLEQVDRLKADFDLAYNNSEPKENLIGFIEKMREHHGCVSYEIYKKMSSITDPASVPKTEYVNISIMGSVEHLIHSHIRDAERMMYKISRMSSKNASAMIISDSEITPRTSAQIHQPSASMGSQSMGSTRPVPGSNNATIKSKSPTTEELSLGQPDLTEQLPTGMSESAIQFIPAGSSSSQGSNQSSMRNRTSTMNQSRSANRKSIETMTDAPMSEGLTDVINGINTTEADNLLRDYQSRVNNSQSTQAGGGDFDIAKPTVILYWVDWCGYCKKFKPEWSKFKESVASTVPGLQVLELEVKGDEASALAKKVDVKGYPTLVLFKDGKITKQAIGNGTANGVVAFLKDNGV